MVSIIVPIYRVETYLRRCVDSILKQTYKDIEVILVDDGSPDNCGKICEELALNDCRIRVIHKKNGGLSSARNAGLQIAKGEYICFVDSDDWIAENYVECLLRTIFSYNADMSACNLQKIHDGDEQQTKQSDKVDLIDDEKYLCALTESSFAGYAWNKMFRAAIIESNSLHFDEQIFNGEDLPFVLEYLQYCNKVAYIKNVLYYYYIRPGSITTTVGFSDKQYTIIYAREKVLQIISRVDSECVDTVICGYLFHLIKMKYQLYPKRKAYMEKYVEVSKKINRYKNKILTLNGVALMHRLQLYLMVRFYRISGLIYRRSRGIE